MKQDFVMSAGVVVLVITLLMQVAALFGTPVPDPGVVPKDKLKFTCTRAAVRGTRYDTALNDASNFGVHFCQINGLYCVWTGNLISCTK